MCVTLWLLQTVHTVWMTAGELVYITWRWRQTWSVWRSSYEKKWDGKMALSSNLILTIVFVVIIWIVGFVLLFLGNGLRSALAECNNVESPSCLMLTCSPDGYQGTTVTCGSFAYRCNDDGTVTCSNAPTSKVKNQDADICVVNPTNATDIPFSKCKQAA